MGIESLLSSDSNDSQPNSTDSRSRSATSGKQLSREDMVARMRNIDPYEFEHFVADLWDAQGWDTEVSQASNDMGVDVIAEKSDGMVDQKVAIQAKRYSGGNKVGQPKIQQYHALKEQDTGADAAVVVTTSSFTKNGREWAEEHNVKLVNGEDLVSLIEGQYEHILEEYAPTLDSIEAEESTSESASTGMPNELRENNELIAGAIGGFAVLILFAGEMSEPAILATALAGGLALGVYYAPEQLWELATGEQEVIHSFQSGAAVVEQRGTIKYVSDEGETVTFDSDDEQTNRQRAVVYATLKEKYGDFKEIEGGAVPTEIVSAGDEHVSAYRFAVQQEPPAGIASDMDISQKEVTNHLSGFVS